MPPHAILDEHDCAERDDVYDSLTSWQDDFPRGAQDTLTEAGIEGFPADSKTFFIGSAAVVVIGTWGRLIHDQDRTLQRSWTWRYGMPRPVEASRVRTAETQSLKSVINDTSQTLDRRYDALSQISDDEWLRVYIVNELGRGDEQQFGWHCVLVQAAEMMQFDDQVQRAKLRDSLLTMALRIRDSDDESLRYVADSAIRTYSSMIAPTELATLRPLLESCRAVDTWLVALQCIANVCHRGPITSQTEELNALRERINQLAVKFLDSDWLKPGENAAIGQWAIVALGCIADPRVVDRASDAAALGLKWFVRQLSNKLQRVREGWRPTRATDSAATAACDALSQSIERLSAVSPSQI